MIVYHGSSMLVESPDIYHSRDNVDFGKGFYVTAYKEQAEKWAARFKKRNGQGVVSMYEFNLDACREAFQIMEFDKYNDEWLDFILDCRNAHDESTFDIVIGGVANDKVFNTIELFLDGLIEKQEAIKRLRYMRPNSQICIRNQELIKNYLVFLKSEEI